MFGFLAQLLSWCYQVWPNYAAMILLFTLIVMVVVTPFTIKGMRSAAEMARLQPEMKKLQDQYKNDRVKQNEEMQALFKEHGVNPLGGCLPTLLPLPIFFIIFRLLERMNARHTGAFAPLVRLLRHNVGGGGRVRRPPLPGLQGHPHPGHHPLERQAHGARVRPGGDRPPAPQLDWRRHPLLRAHRHHDDQPVLAAAPDQPAQPGGRQRQPPDEDDDAAVPGVLRRHLPQHPRRRGAVPAAQRPVPHGPERPLLSLRPRARSGRRAPGGSDRSDQPPQGAGGRSQPPGGRKGSAHRALGPPAQGRRWTRDPAAAKWRLPSAGQGGRRVHGPATGPGGRGQSPGRAGTRRRWPDQWELEAAGQARRQGPGERQRHRGEREATARPRPARAGRAGGAGGGRARRRHGRRHGRDRSRERRPRLRDRRRRSRGRRRHRRAGATAVVR